MKFSLVILLLLLCACNREQADRLTIDKLRTAYQFYIDREHIICIYLDDKWGENNSIKIYDRRLAKLDEGSFAVDPVPFLVGKEKDSLIILEYFTKGNKFDDSRGIRMKKNRLSKLGDFGVDYRITGGIMGNAIGEKIIIDKLSMNHNRDSVFLSTDHSNFQIPLKYFIFKDGDYQFIEIIDGLIYYNTLELNRDILDHFYSTILSEYIHGI